MKTTVKQQKIILSMVKAELATGAGVKSIAALLRGYGNPDNVQIIDCKICVRVSHETTFLYANSGY